MAESKTTRWRRENPDKWGKQRDAYRETRNKRRREKYAGMTPSQRKKVNEVRRRRRKLDPDANKKSKQYQRLDVLRKCGMSLPEAREWYATREMVCEVCGSTEKLGIDHDHDVRRVRGILCRSCNLGIGHLKDDVGLVSRALEYLKSYGGDEGI